MEPITEPDTALVPASVGPPPMTPSRDAARRVDIIRRRMADSSLLAYEADWNHFTEWCAVAGHSPVPASEDALLDYIDFCTGPNARSTATRCPPKSTPLSMSSIRRRLAAITFAHNAAGLPLPAYPIVKDRLGVAEREIGTAKRQARPITQVQLIQILGLQPDSPAGLRNRALLLLGFTTGLRRAELVAVDRGHVSFLDEGVSVFVPKSKTDQGRNGRTVSVPYSPNTDTCTGTALRRWFAVPGDSDGAVFRRVLKGGTVSAQRLAPDAVSLLVKTSVSQLGEDPAEYSAHSLRAGLATALAREGVPLPQIMGQTGHADVHTAMGYVRLGTAFRDNPVAKLGGLYPS